MSRTIALVCVLVAPLACGAPDDPASDHGQGHTIPDATDSVLQFFHDHPWGTVPSPYVQGLPPGFPEYCVLP